MNGSGLFKGYVKTVDKKCAEKLKDRTDFKTLDEVKGYSEYAGVLADDAILYDYDTKRDADIFMNIVEGEQLDCMVKQTSRGKHGYSKNTLIDKCYTGAKLACGLTADIKVGCKTSYAVLKYNGEERFTEWDIEEGKEYQELPKYFHPVASKFDFVGMVEGDGRDSALYSYILVLQSAGFTDEEIKETIRIINTYVLKEPLSDEDIQRITRNEAFQKEAFFKGAVFQHDVFGRYLINQENVIKIGGRLYVYDNGVYSDDLDKLNSKIREKIPNIKKQQKAELLDYLKDVAPEKMQAEPKLIAFKNGIFDISSGTLSPLSPDFVVTNLIPWNYNARACSETANNTLNKICCDDKSIRSLIEEMIGYCFYRQNSLEKAFILVGEKANGKSTLIHVISRMLGDDNISALDLKNIGDRFSKASLLGKLANVGDDISDEFIADPSLFKKISSGMQIQAEFKGQNEFKFNPFCKLIFSSNSIPRIKDKSGAVIRRLIIIPFNAHFSEADSDYDPFIKNKLCSQESIEYFIKIGIDGLTRLLQTNRFTKSEKVEKEIEEYRETNNPVIQFVNELEDGADYLTRNTVTDVYRLYSTFCYQNGLQAESSVQFGKSVRYLFGLESKPVRISGKAVRIYKKVT